MAAQKFNPGPLLTPPEEFAPVEKTTPEIIAITWLCMDRYNEQRDHPHYFMPLRILEAYKRQEEEKASYQLAVLIGEAISKKAEVQPKDFNFHTAWIREPDPERLLCFFELTQEGKDKKSVVTIGNSRLVEENETFP